MKNLQGPAAALPADGHDYLAQHGEALIAQGYHPIPIKRGKKAPGIDEWQKTRADKAQLQAWLKDPAHRRAGVGIVTGNIVAVDIDVLDPVMAARLQAWCLEHLGPAPVRIGKAPKAALLYQTDAPFKKMVSASYVDGDPDFPDRHRIEVLGDGQQLVAFHIHPGTGKPYRWVDDRSPLNVKAGELPTLTPDQVLELFAEFDRLAAAERWTRATDANTRPAAVATALDNPWVEDSHKLDIEPEVLRDALTYVPGGDDYDRWTPVGMGLHHQFDGDDQGFQMWVEWSMAAGNFKEGKCEEKWPTFNITGKGRAPLTARYIIKLARAAGWIDPRGLVDTGGDLTLGYAFAKRYRGQFLHCVTAKQWLMWNDQEGRWCWCSKGEHTHAAFEIITQAFREARDALSPDASPSEKARLAQAAKATRNAANFAPSVLTVASAAGGLALAHPGDLDADPLLLGVRNGVLDLRNGVLMQGRPDMLMTRQAGAAFNPDAECPHWLKLLQEVFCGDPEMIDFMQRVLGYVLTGLVDEEMLFFAYGHGANGKSVFANVIAAILGDYAVTCDSMMLAGQGRMDGREVLYEKARLVGMRLALLNELSVGSVWDDQTVKTIASRERLKARAFHGSPFDFFPTHKAFVRGNHQPGAKDTTDGFWRRMALIPFKRQFTKGEQDPFLESAILNNERDGVLAWMVRGCIAWQQEGRKLRLPKSMQAEVNQYRKESDILGLWMEERTVCEPAARATTPELFDSYQTWCRAQNMTAPSSTTFGRYLSQRNFKSKRSNGKTVWTGLGLRPDSAWATTVGDGL